MTTTITMNYPPDVTTAGATPLYDDLMQAILHIADVLGTDETIDGDHRYEWTEVWDTVHRLLDPDFEERWVPGDNP